MKTLSYLIILVISISQTFAQLQLRDEEWRSDLEYLQKTIHQEYSHLFQKVTKQEFDAAVNRLNDEIPEMETHEIIVGLAKLVAMFKVGHTSMSLFMARHGERLTTGFTRLPYELYQFNDGFYLQGVHSDFKKALGAKVVRIGNLSIEEAFAAISPVVSVENEQYLKAYGIGFLSCPQILHATGVIDEVNNVSLVFEKDGKEFEINFGDAVRDRGQREYGYVQNIGGWLDARTTSTKDPLWLKEIDKSNYFEYLEDEKLVYVRQSQIRNAPNESIAEFYTRVLEFVERNEVEKFVLDVRLNGGGNNYLNRPIIVGLIQSKINRKGKLFTIIGRRTFSACQNLVNELEKYTETIFVGEPTAENVNFFGDNRQITLPNSQLAVRLSYLWWQDGDPRDSRRWTAPDIAVDLSFEDYQTNHDPVMEAILNYDPDYQITDGLKSLFEEGKFKEAKNLAFKDVNNPLRKYQNFESDINAMGYRFLGAKNWKAAVAIFGLNVELYPESANVWDSLAESYWKSNNAELAIKYYKKALTMDPQGRTGQNAERMLGEIRSHQ